MRITVIYVEPKNRSPLPPLFQMFRKASGSTAKRKFMVFKKKKYVPKMSKLKLKNHVEDIFTNELSETMISYLLTNLVRAGIAEKEEDYLYSSCGDYLALEKDL